MVPSVSTKSQSSKCKIWSKFSQERLKVAFGSITNVYKPTNRSAILVACQNSSSPLVIEFWICLLGLHELHHRTLGLACQQRSKKRARSRDGVLFLDPCWGRACVQSSSNDHICPWVRSNQGADNDDASRCSRSSWSWACTFGPRDGRLNSLSLTWLYLHDRCPHQQNLVPRHLAPILHQLSAQRYARHRAYLAVSASIDPLQKAARTSTYPV